MSSTPNKITSPGLALVAKILNIIVLISSVVILVLLSLEIL